MSSNGGPRWLLLGAAGLVGSHLLGALRGRQLVATTHRTSVAGAMTLDLTDPIAVRSAVREARPEIVVVTAAEAFVERCEKEPAATAAVNVDALRTIADSAQDALLVIFSSEYVFDGRSGPYGEDDPLSPINEYGRQKVLAEAIARERRAHLICRLSGVYGWSPGRTSFVAQLVDRLRAGRRFSVPADQVITPTPAPDLARAVIELVERGTFGTVHAAGPEILPRPEFARRAAEIFGLDPSLLESVPTDRLGLAAPRPLDAGLRTDKLVAILGHRLSGSADGLAEMRDAEER